VTCTISNDDDVASLLIIKDVVNDNGGDAVLGDFGITTSAGALAFDAGTVAGATTTYTATALTVDSNTAFDLAEVDFAGYTEGDWTCSNGDGGTFDTGSVTLNEGETVTCTIVNDDDTASLTIVKEVLNDNGGTGVVADFGITTDAGALVFDAGTTAGDTTTYTATTLPVNANTAFSLSEIDLDAYAEGDWSCSNGESATFDSGSVTLLEGEAVTCTISNDDKGVDLSIVKTVDNMTPDIGDIITFSLQVSNAGPDEATDVSVDDVLPAGFVYGVTTATAGVTETTVAAPNLAWTIDSIPSGGSVTIEYTATVLAP
ncbi:MAG: DUF11 domain-containing protein, partial [Methylococcales bacterium]|nr:DUF11 domain-containing protein [Methylococcales bacterium]